MHRTSEYTHLMIKDHLKLNLGDAEHACAILHPPLLFLLTSETNLTWPWYNIHTCTSLLVLAAVWLVVTVTEVQWRKVDDWSTRGAGDGREGLTV